MKKIIILIVIGILTIPINAQQTQENLDYLKNANKMIKTGTTLTLVGVGATIGGAIMLGNGMGHKYPSTIGHITSDTYTSTGGVIGAGIMLVGVILTGTGVSTLIVGSIQKGRAQRNLQVTLGSFKSPINNASINGIGLIIRF